MVWALIELDASAKAAIKAGAAVGFDFMILGSDCRDSRRANVHGTTETIRFPFANRSGFPEVLCHKIELHTFRFRAGRGASEGDDSPAHLVRNDADGALAPELKIGLSGSRGRHRRDWIHRFFGWLDYEVRRWDRSRWVIAKAEHSGKGRNPRYVVTTLEGDPHELYDRIYCARGDMESRIKERQLGLFADRTSCHAWWLNPLRLLLSTLAHVLIDGLRRLALAGTDWARKQATALRAGLLKIGAVITRYTRRVRVHLSGAWPWREVFALAHERLRSG
jgi:hypothetical protein